MRRKVISIEIVNNYDIEHMECRIIIEQESFSLLKFRWIPKQERYTASWPFVDWVDLQALRPVPQDLNSYLCIAFKYRNHLES